MCIPFLEDTPASHTSPSRRRVGFDTIQRPKNPVACGDTLQLSAPRHSETPSPMTYRDQYGYLHPFWRLQHLPIETILVTPIAIQRPRRLGACVDTLRLSTSCHSEIPSPMTHGDQCGDLYPFQRCQCLPVKTNLISHFCYPATQESGGMWRHLTIISTSSFGDTKSIDT